MEMLCKLTDKYEENSATTERHLEGVKAEATGLSLRRARYILTTRPLYFSLFWPSPAIVKHL